ncbi:hypothetical protein ACFQT0_10185 [Hymenobacter humi]|uniref:Uncharacterized protein n=1 Tax=Hymenobacter humi TaxID=1411620 RepID=A0ABW2U4C8_9BACT
MPQAVGEQGIKAGTFVHLVEVGQRLAGVQLLTAGGVHRRPVGVVEQAFGQVAGHGQVFEALLVLNADGVAAKLGGDAHGGDVHLALLQGLGQGQLGGLLGAPVKFHALGEQPIQHPRASAAVTSRMAA